jgi:hypothetical protein
MINLEEHVVEFDGKKYIPVDIVNKYVTQQYGKKMDSAMGALDEAMDKLNNSLLDAVK